ncbi:MAG: hypothetical protein Dasosvirus11_9, partial [Dasosvirus sp.]
MFDKNRKNKIIETTKLIPDLADIIVEYNFIPDSTFETCLPLIVTDSDDHAESTDLNTDFLKTFKR